MENLKKLIAVSACLFGAQKYVFICGFFCYISTLFYLSLLACACVCTRVFVCICAHVFVCMSEHVSACIPLFSPPLCL